LSASLKRSRTPLIAANWKMNKTSSEAVEFLSAFKSAVRVLEGREVVICPSFTALEAVRQAIQGTPFLLGSQNVHDQPSGAFTGEVSAGMLLSAGCRYVILGHSERRQYFGETDEWVNKKLRAALAAKLIPILCVGEMQKEREAGKTIEVVGRQLRGSLQGFSATHLGTLAIAYEPVWAIGTGRTATPAQAEEVHAFIRKTISELFGEPNACAMRILYGGSIKPDNIDDLMAQPDLDGGLVGGASLEAASFARIVNFVS
jgi:triosephosphate isomerase